MIVVAILAILSVIAVPSFIKYMRRAKTAEAVEQLELVFRGAVQYFITPRAHASGPSLGGLADCRFPDPIGATPASSCCDPAVDTDSDGRCDSADETVWSAASWQAMNFEVKDHHLFVYALESQGANDDARFRAMAHGDLDCDGTSSTFTRGGIGVAATGTRECAVRSSSSLAVFNETE